MSCPSNVTVPPVGIDEAEQDRPTVVLPQPDSPTRPRVSPRRIVEAHVVDGLHVPDLAMEHPARAGRTPRGS